MVSFTNPLSEESVGLIDDLNTSLKDSTKEISFTSSIPKTTNVSKEGYLASKLARKKSDRYVKTSKSYSAKYENALPKLASAEIQFGELLGEGGFSKVFEIKSFSLIENSEEEDEDQRRSREFLKVHVYREKTGDGRYVVKQLRRNIVENSEIFPTAAMYFALECKILCSIFHPNIIKLRGVCSEGEMGFMNRKPEGYFLVLDRLDETLDQRIKKWKEARKKNKGKSLVNCKQFELKILCWWGEKVEEIPDDKLKIICDISSALQYLHKRNIIYRDLKPENFGFDERGDVKLFDFALSREISSCEKMDNGTYKLTGYIGTLLYMAPEVIKSETYNLSADVYSFSIMLWEILTLKKPFKNYSKEEHYKFVAHGTDRPKIIKSFPLPIQTLLREGWSPHLHDRPSFDEIFDILSEMPRSQIGSSIRAGLSRRRIALDNSRYSQIKELVLDDDSLRQ